MFQTLRIKCNASHANRLRPRGCLKHCSSFHDLDRNYSLDNAYTKLFGERGMFSSKNRAALWWCALFCKPTPPTVVQRRVNKKRIHNVFDCAINHEQRLLGIDDCSSIVEQALHCVCTHIHRCVAHDKVAFLGQTCNLSGFGRMAPPTSRISAMLKRVQEHSSPRSMHQWQPAVQAEVHHCDRCA